MMNVCELNHMKFKLRLKPRLKRMDLMQHDLWHTLYTVFN